MLHACLVPSRGIEPLLQVPETYVLSIERRRRRNIVLPDGLEPSTPAL